MKRLRKGKCTIGLGLVLSDLAMNYERVLITAPISQYI